MPALGEKEARIACGTWSLEMWLSFMARRLGGLGAYSRKVGVGVAWAVFLRAKNRLGYGRSGKWRSVAACLNLTVSRTVSFLRLGAWWLHQHLVFVGVGIPAWARFSAWTDVDGEKYKRHTTATTTITGGSEHEGSQPTTRDLTLDHLDSTPPPLSTYPSLWTLPRSRQFIATGVGLVSLRGFAHWRTTTPVAHFHRAY